jgi:hypothetical protein
MKRAYAWTGTTPGSGAITADYGQEITSWTWAVYEITGASSTDPFIQTVGATPGGGDTSVTVTLSAFSDSANRPLIAAEHATAEASTEEGGYTEIADQTITGNDMGFAVAWHSTTTDTTPSYSWTTVTSNRIGIASEIAIGNAGLTVTPDFLDYSLTPSSPSVTGVAASAPTLIFLDSFGGAIAIANSGTGLIGTYTLISSTNITLDTTIKRTTRHRASLKILENGAAATQIYKTLTATGVLVGSFYIRLVTAPTAISEFARVQGPTNPPTFRFLTDGKLQVIVGGLTATSAGSYADGAFHLIDFRLDVQTATTTVEWSIDSVAQPTASLASQTPLNIDRWVFGSTVAAHNATFWISDAVLSTTTGDYPIGAHLVLPLDPNADGTHSLGGHITNAASGTTDLYQSVRDWPASPATYIVQSTAGTDYAEINFIDPQEATVWDVAATLAGVSDATPANNAELRILESGGTQLSTTGALDYSSPTLGYHRFMVARPAGGWDGTKLTGAKARWGFSTDTVPTPRIVELLLEYAAPEGQTFPLIDHALTPFDPAVQNALVLAPAIIDHSLAALQPVVTDTTFPGQIQPAVISNVLSPFAPTVGDIEFTFGDYFDIYTTDYETAGLVSHVLTPFDLSVTFGTGTLEVAPPLIDGTLVAFDPSLQGDQLVFMLTRTDHTLVAFAPSPTFAGVDQTVSVDRIDHSLTIFTPAVSGPVLAPLINMTLTPQALSVVQEPSIVVPPGTPNLIANIDLGQGYENFVGYLRTFTWRRGRARERDRMGAGTAQAVFDNRSGRFDRDLHPEMRPNRRVQFLARVDTGINPWRMGRTAIGSGSLVGVLEGGSLTLPIFTGRTEGGPMAFSQTKADSTVTWSFVDDSKRLNRDRSATGFGIGPELTGARVDRILDATTPAWQPGREVDAGTRLVQPEVGTQGRFDYLLVVAESEGGAFFLGADGSAIFRDVTYEPSPDPVAYGDDPAERRYLDISIGDDDKEIFNAITVTAPNQTNIEVTDIDSMAEFGRSDLSISTILANALDMQDLADFVLAGYAEPRRRISRLSLGTRDTNWSAVLGTELLERITARHRPLYGPMLEQELAVQGITGTVNSKFEWRIDWDLATPLADVRLNLLSANASSMETDISDWFGIGPLTVFNQGTLGYIGTHSLFGFVESSSFVEFHLHPSAQPAVTPGETYEAVGYFFTQLPGQIIMGIWFNDSNGNFVDATFGPNQYEPAINTWTRLTVTAVAPAGAAKAEIVFMWSPSAGQYMNMWVDAVSFKQRS